MKEDINLMPPAATSARRKRLLQSRLAAVYRYFLAAIVLVGAGYGVAWGVLWYTAIPTEEVAVTGRDDVEKQTRQINAQMQLVHRQLVEQPPWLTQVGQALALAPASVTLTAIDIEATTQTVMISGRGQEREAVVQFERALRALPWAKSVEAPLQNFASGPDVTFRFTIVRRL